jgi:8-oxo-dGTP pyrophosphatase MutT (NUDIX family)
MFKAPTTAVCNNCNKIGHVFYNCKHPVTSVGIVAFRQNNADTEYLMIRRKHSLGYMDFMRGKYPLYNRLYLANIISEMTNAEKHDIQTQEFDTLWNSLWGDAVGIQYRGEEKASREKFDSLKLGIVVGSSEFNLNTLLQESTTSWTEPEWGFPKGRHNNKENDIQCALREFEEETGFLRTDLKLIQNIVPFEEIFTGSNYKSYKHKYFVAAVALDQLASNPFQETEVSQLEWKSYKDALALIRSYNVEKKEVLSRIHTVLHTYNLCPV